MAKIFYYIRLSRNPIRGEVTELFYYIRLPRNPIRGEVTLLLLSRVRVFVVPDEPGEGRGEIEAARLGIR